MTKVTKLLAHSKFVIWEIRGIPLRSKYVFKFSSSRQTKVRCLNSKVRNIYTYWPKFVPINLIAWITVTFWFCMKIKNLLSEWSNAANNRHSTNQRRNFLLKWKFQLAKFDCGTHLQLNWNALIISWPLW